jgi:lipoprotein-anchoring transpeptidase ErfK/SrfK
VGIEYVGKPATPTPKGTFTIINKAYKPGGVFGTNNPSSIGKAVSNGCVRMYNKDVIELYNLVPVGATVRIV